MRYRRSLTAGRSGASSSRSPAGAPRGPPQPEGLAVKERKELGRVAPGECLPLPLGWHRTGGWAGSWVGWLGKGMSGSMFGMPGARVVVKMVCGGCVPLCGAPLLLLLWAQCSRCSRRRFDVCWCAGRQMQLRPVVDAELDLAAHDWSVGASDGLHTIKLECLDSSTTRLVYCDPLLPQSGWLRCCLGCAVAVVAQGALLLTQKGWLP